MTILHTVPSDARVPGSYQELKFGAAGRLQPGVRRVALLGQRLSTGSVAALVAKEVYSDEEADTYFGIGSELALMCRWAIKAAKRFGLATVQLLAVPIAAAAGTARQFTFTITGPATAGGDLVVKIAGRTIRVGVDAGDSATTIATALDSAIDALKAELPVTSSSSSDVVTCLANQAAANGNDISFEAVSQPAGVTNTAVQTVAGSGTVDITTALDVLATYDPVDYIAIANHASTDVSDFDAHLDSMWLPAQKYWRWGVMAETGSLATAQALATAANDYRQLVISAEGFRNTPGEIAAYVAMVLAGESDPALPFNDVELPDVYLPPDASLPTRTELETALAGGLLPLSANDAKSSSKIVRAVTTKVAHNSVPYFDLLDVTISRTMAFVMRQVDIAIRLEVGVRQKKSNRVKKLVRSVVYRTLKLLEAAELVQNVDAHAAELQVENDVADPTALVVAIPASIVPPLNKVIGVFSLIVE